MHIQNSFHEYANGYVHFPLLDFIVDFEVMCSFAFEYNPRCDWTIMHSLKF